MKDRYGEGSFSTRQLDQLKRSLEKESKEQSKKLKGREKKKFVPFQGDWKAYFMWQKKGKKQQAGAGTKAVSQCVKDRTGMDLGLDLPPSRQCQPATTGQEQPTSPYAKA